MYEKGRGKFKHKIYACSRFCSMIVMIQMLTKVEEFRPLVRQQARRIQMLVLTAKRRRRNADTTR